MPITHFVHKQNKTQHKKKKKKGRTKAVSAMLAFRREEATIDSSEGGGSEEQAEDERREEDNPEIDDHVLFMSMQPSRSDDLCGTSQEVGGADLLFLAPTARTAGRSVLPHPKCVSLVAGRGRGVALLFFPSHPPPPPPLPPPPPPQVGCLVRRSVPAFVRVHVWLWTFMTVYLLMF